MAAAMTELEGPEVFMGKLYTISEGRTIDRRTRRGAIR